jgi:hypothetical protein
MKGLKNLLKVVVVAIWTVVGLAAFSGASAAQGDAVRCASGACVCEASNTFCSCTANAGSCSAGCGSGSISECVGFP